MDVWVKFKEVSLYLNDFPRDGSLIVQIGSTSLSLKETLSITTITTGDSQLLSPSPHPPSR